MSWFKLKSPFGANYRVDPNDLMNTKRALSQLGYYDVPQHRGIDDWTDDATFDGIRRFQRDNGLKVDGFLRPGGPTERAMNQRMAGGSGYPAIDPSGLFNQFSRYAANSDNDFAEAGPPWKPRPPNPSDPGCRASGTCDIFM